MVKILYLFSSAYKYEPASVNDWGRSFTYNRKRSGPTIEFCGKPYVNVLALEKTLSIQTKYFLFER